jgi:GntR family transcriptional regulator, rspAB operon transcriptional repressor
LAYQRAAFDSGDVQGFHELDTRFRRQMAEGLDLVRVSEGLDPVRTHLERVRRTLLPEPGPMEETSVEHQEILSATARRRPERAREAMGLHLDHVSRQLQTFVAQHPGFFED